MITDRSLLWSLGATRNCKISLSLYCEFLITKGLPLINSFLKQTVLADVSESVYSVTFSCSSSLLPVCQGESVLSECESI